MNARTASLHSSLALSLVLLTACGPDVAGQAELRHAAEAFVPEDAADKSLAPDMPWVQISFDVRRPWLKFAVDEERLNRAELDGWKVCRPQTTEWRASEDFVATPPSYRRIRTYVLYRDGISVQIIGMYERPLESVGLEGEGEQPVQQGFVIARNATAKEARQVAENFRLSCEARVEEK